MPRMRDIVKFVKRERGRVGLMNGRVTDRYVIGGCCENVQTVVDSFGGNVYRSKTAKSVPEQRFPGHSIAVVPVSKHTGVVVDFTDTAKGPIIGVVSDVHNQRLTLEELGELTGSGDWKKKNK